MENNPLERPNYWGVLPAAVRYADISASAKVMFAEITALSNSLGACWATNKYFAELYGVQNTTISEWVKQLETANLISTKVIKGGLRAIHVEIALYPSGKAEDRLREKPKHNNKTNNNSIVDLKASKESEASLLLLVNEVTGRQFRTLPARGVKKTLDAFSLPEIRTALTALTQDGWHSPKMKEFSIDYFIRSTTIDKFLAQGTGNSGVADNGKKYFTEDDDGNRYWGGELVTPQNQDRIFKERNEQ